MGINLTNTTHLVSYISGRDFFFSFSSICVPIVIYLIKQINEFIESHSFCFGNKRVLLKFDNKYLNRNNNIDKYQFVLFQLMVCALHMPMMLCIRRGDNIKKGGCTLFYFFHFWEYF